MVKKIIYERPILKALNPEFVMGGTCEPGFGIGSGSCVTLGNSAASSCSGTGSAAGTSCTAGPNAGSSCGTGTGIGLGS